MKRYISPSIFVLLLSFSLGAGTNSFAQTNLVPDDLEFQALKALYDSLGGPNWTNKTNWPTPGNWPATATAAQMSTWYGITIFNGDIWKVILPGNNLTGKVPAAISQIAQVSQIQLNTNHLNGSLPSSLGSLSKLLWLRLESNQLTGTIPATLGSLSLVQHLYLSGNAFSGNIPATLGNLGNVLVLGLDHNQLTGSVPSSFGNLSSATTLYLNHNLLSGSIPPSLGSASQLRNLYLNNNQLTGSIPQELGNLSALEGLYLGNNLLTGAIPASLGSLSNLAYLHLFNNQLTGSIPAELGSLSKLLQLYIYQNKLSGELPSALGSMAKLQYFTAYTNQFTGTIPASFSNLTDLVVFNVNNNKLSGDVNDIFAPLTKLSNLDLSGNSFTGAFPASIGNCALLTSLNGVNNRITSLPASLLNLPVLTYIGFTGNELVSIPDFSTQVNKTHLNLYLQNNRLDFAQLEPLVNGGILVVSPLSQKTISDVSAVRLTAGNPLVLTARPAGQFSTVIWDKQNANSAWVTLANDDDSNPQTYTRTTAAPTDEGVYRWRMNNTKVTGITIQSEPIKVKNEVSFVLDDLAFQYKYDARRRMTHKKVPGADWVYMVYDNRDRLVMTQDGEQRKTNKWSYTKYDALNRPVMTGIYTSIAIVDQAGMSALISTTNFFETYNGNTGTHGYTSTVFPTASLEVLTVTYYDTYSFKDLINDTAFDYLPNDISCVTVNGVNHCQEPAAFNRTTGQVTGTKTKVLGQSVYLWQATYYDDDYRPVQTITHNYKGGIDRQTSIVDFTGKVLKTETTHTISGGTSRTIARKFDYDHTGRLLKTWHSLNGAAPVLLAQNEYNEIGQLVTKNLYNTNPESTPDANRVYKQQLDYRYNIRGWLTRMNNSDLSVTENGPRDYFGMDLLYNEYVAALGNQPAFNGNISAMKWSTNLGLGTSVPLLELDEPKENAYTFSYDTLNRLKSASFHTKATAWSTSPSFYEGNLKYDRNGNIQKLNRTATSGSLMDQLSYTYAGNQLLKVSDASDKTKGFIDGPGFDNDYAYDANGNMNLDRNKDITAITYNHLNLPDRVTKATGDYIKYTYDATGRKLSQGVYKVNNTLQKKTDYAGEFFYENDTLKFVNHEEGRVVMTGTAPEYQYHLKDHLGNVRLTFTSKQEEETATATLEDVNVANEQGKFLYYNEAVKVYSRLFDHTNNASNGDGYAIRLTGATTDKEYGLTKSLSVMPGDTVKMEVFAKYVTGTSGNNTWTTDLANTMLSIANNAAGVVVDGGAAGSIGNQTFPFAGLINRTAESGTPPKAYLNWLVFNKSDVLIDFGYIPVTTAAQESGANGAHEHLKKDDLVVREPGYVYIYLSNESPTSVEVFFDDFRVEHVKSAVVAIDDYYPLGLVFNSYQRENSTKNRYLYNQGAGDKKFNTERVVELDLNVDLSRDRTYDYMTGRWWQIDPKADSLVGFTPYNYAFNNPIRYNDPYGDCPPGDPRCSGGKSVLGAALQSNVTTNIRSAGSSASNIVSGTVGVQAAGIGGNIKIASVLHVEATGKAFSGEASLSSNGPDANVNVVQTDFGLQVGPLGGSFSQNDMIYDGQNFEMRDQSGSLSAGSLQYGTSENEISMGATGGNLSGEISFNLDAVQQTLDSTVEAVKGFFQNLIQTNPWQD